MCAAGGWLLAVFACSLALPSPAPPLSATARRLRRAAAGPCSLSLTRAPSEVPTTPQNTPRWRLIIGRRRAAAVKPKEPASERATHRPSPTPRHLTHRPASRRLWSLLNARTSPRPAAMTPRLRLAKTTVHTQPAQRIILRTNYWHN